MAGRVFEIAFQLAGRVNSSFNSAFGNANAQLEEMNDNAAELQDQSDGLAAGLTSVGVAAAGIGLAVGAASLAVGGLAVNISDNLQKSLNGVQAATGATDEAMGDMRTTMLSIYNNNFGESFADISKAMSQVGSQTGASGKALEALTSNALMIRDTFEMEVTESVRAADMMMKQFGISGDEAYNLIAQGSQKGLNKNQNLADTVNEYSVHFKQLGFSSEEMFNSMANGAATGVYDLDKLGDAVKEFGIRSKDGSKTSTEGFEALGLNAATMTEAFAAGGDTAKAAFDKTAKALFALKDPVKKEAAGVALFGTQWEDVGVKGMEALVNTKGSIDENIDALGKINSVKYNTFSEAMVGIKRNLETGILIPLGDKILPKLNQFAGWITTNMPAIQNEISYAMDIAGSAITKVGTAITATKTFFEEHWNIVGPIIAGIGAGAITFGAITLATKAWTVATNLATAAQTAMGIAMNLTPMGKAIALVGLLVAGGVLLYQNWDTVSAKADEVGRVIGNAFKSGVNIAIDAINWLSDKLNDVLGVIGVKIPSVAHIALSAAPPTRNSYNALKGVGNNAGGTDDWRGGLTWVGEKGPELLNLPGGSQIIPNNSAISLMGAKGRAVGNSGGGQGEKNEFTFHFHIGGGNKDEIMPLLEKAKSEFEVIVERVMDRRAREGRRTSYA